MELAVNSEIFTRATEEIISPGELERLLASKKRLRLKFGADVTAADLHIGHAVNLWKMRELQELGHKVVFLIGDFTAKIGDPTGRLHVRSGVARRDAEKWADSFLKQAGLVLRTDRKVFEVRRNSEWYGKMKAEELIRLLSLFTHARLIERDMFRKRMAENKEIFLPELIYPVLQGYDSVMLKTDMTVIGSDQLFNENIGRFLQEKFGQPKQIIVTTSITPGIDGREKMSKSRGNYIGLNDSPRDKFGKIMRLPDGLIVPYLEVYTKTPSAKIRDIGERLKKGGNPMQAKIFLAEELVKRYHGTEIVSREREYFLKVFSGRKIPEDLPEIKFTYGERDAAEFLVAAGFARSKSDARRMVKQGAVEIDGAVVPFRPGKITVNIKKGSVVKFGKRMFARIK